MMQPNLNQTFDTSLVDLAQSLETSTTMASTSAPKPTSKIQHMDTQGAYNQWSSIYDTDGNILQAIDDDELSTLLPQFLAQVTAQTPTGTIRILDLGCGTGRNTAKLLEYKEWPTDQRVEIIGIDISEGMLNVAARKLGKYIIPNKYNDNDDNNNNTTTTNATNKTTHSPPTLTLKNLNLFTTPTPAPHFPFPCPPTALISTLILEHIPLPPFFATLSALLPPTALALITNMHADMGARTQAGFTNEHGAKVRGVSWVYSVEDVVGEARKQGFEVMEVREREVRRGDLESGVVGGRGGKWVGVRVWVGVVVRKRGG
ncbi:S-adenosyl-L-methionine-dependent methyltransferase [Plenodomus tracheiphilus IPT5]|uniref:S-adenosyl-L-methionine-dependent methyltransferase n=1 Tax=Plenodomus tracheiphilus IPT5 TaxID=1408161 RepID=A0A6A7AXY1_9PLEO|nr:S-adenosyl-L-methionine-dependent methyltransferase [Plenodomus tracheiphilus IPT5]